MDVKARTIERCQILGDLIDDYRQLQGTKTPEEQAVSEKLIDLVKSADQEHWLVSNQMYEKILFKSLKPTPSRLEIIEPFLAKGSESSYRILIASLYALYHGARLKHLEPDIYLEGSCSENLNYVMTFVDQPDQKFHERLEAFMKKDPDSIDKHLSLDPHEAKDFWQDFNTQLLEYINKFKNGDWPVGEKLLSRTPEIALNHIKNKTKEDLLESFESHILEEIKKDRRPTLQSTEKQDEYVQAFYTYSRDVLRARWPEAEEAVEANASSNETQAIAIAKYARDVIRGPWEKVERRILKHEKAKQIYENILLKKLISSPDQTSRNNRKTLIL